MSINVSNVSGADVSGGRCNGRLQRTRRVDAEVIFLTFNSSKLLVLIAAEPDFDFEICFLPSNMQNPGRSWGGWHWLEAGRQEQLVGHPGAKPDQQSHDHHLEVVHLLLHHLLLLHHHLHPKQPESLQVCEQHLDALLPVASAELL